MKHKLDSLLDLHWIIEKLVIFIICMQNPMSHLLYVSIKLIKAQTTQIKAI